jgi:hypothetical protein
MSPSRAPGVPVNADVVCFGPYTEVRDDQALRTSAGQGHSSGDPNYDPAAPSELRCDDVEHGAFGAGVAAWYHLPPGRGLATAPPGMNHCGTWLAGWLSGWHGVAGTAPDDDEYAVPADRSLSPAVGLPPADGLVCFDYGRKTCFQSAPVRAVGCGDFALWNLPPAQTRCAAYCLAD